MIFLKIACNIFNNNPKNLLDAILMGNSKYVELYLKKGKTNDLFIEHDKNRHNKILNYDINNGNRKFYNPIETLFNTIMDENTMLEILELLLKYGEDPNYKYEYGFNNKYVTTPYFQNFKSTEILELLRHYGLDLDESHYGNANILLDLLLDHNLFLAKYIIDKGYLKFKHYHDPTYLKDQLDNLNDDLLSLDDVRMLRWKYFPKYFESIYIDPMNTSYYDIIVKDLTKDDIEKIRNIINGHIDMLDKIISEY